LLSLPAETSAQGFSATWMKTPAAAPQHDDRPVIAPLAPRRYLLRVTIGQETHDKLDRVRALLRHSIPTGDLEAILDRALTLLLNEAERTKVGATSRPRDPSRVL
jgi:hypothetical protein